MAQMMIPVSQIEEVAQRVFEEQVEKLRRDLWQEIAAQMPRRSEAEGRVWEAIHELAQAQTRTEERLTRLEAAVEKLAQAQARTEERLTRLEAAVEELAQAQARTEKRVEELARAQARTEKALGELFRHVGHLSNIIGADLEVDAEEVLRYALRQKGYRLLGPARPLEIDGEIDVALPVENPAGEQLWAVVEAKARVREKEVERWSRRFKSARFLRRLNQAGVTGPYLPYIFGLRIYPNVLPMAEEAGVGILDFRGEQAEALVVS